MLWLSSDSLGVRIDPRHGGEVLDLIDQRSGRQLLGRPPFASDEPLSGELDETTWTRSYRGGWQLLVPNAGNPCVVDDVAHGFHGSASTAQWEVASVDAAHAQLEWADHGLHVSRRFAVEGDTLRVRSIVSATRDCTFLWVEHIGLGIELLDPAVEIVLPGGRAYELSERDGPVEPPAGAPSWPEVLLLDGTRERANRAVLTTPRSRLLVVAHLPEGRLTVCNRDRGQGVEIVWDVRWLPHLWMWHESRTTGGPWREMTELLVVEPASVPHTLGLARAREHGQARALAAGESAETEIAVRALSGEQAR
jgi:hypothetical protein